MSETDTARTRYLSLLGFSDKEELARHTVQVIVAALESRRMNDPPIAVSSVAEAFLIAPTPQFDNSINEGTIEFDVERGQFLIKISQRAKLHSLRPSGMERLGGDDLPDLRLTYRGRYTYAHEVAHRFCFVKTVQGWRRAIEIAVREASPGSRAGVLAVLKHSEEELCNRIAGDVLVPRPALDRIFGNILLPDQQAGFARFYHALRQASSLFRVSCDCILVRLERAIRLRQIECAKYLCVLLVRMSDRKIDGRSRRDLRVQQSIIPTTIGGTNIQPLFPGLALRNLGDEVHAFAESFLNRRGTQGIRNVELPMTLQERRGADHTKVHFRGWSMVLFGENAGHSEHNAVLLWGTLYRNQQ